MSTARFIQTGNRPSLRKLGSPLIDTLRMLNDLIFLSAESSTNEDKKVETTKNELRLIGFSDFQLDRRESTHIAAYLNPDEHIKAGIRGHIYGVGGVLIVATDSRILYLHDIPLFSNFEEFSYDFVTGISINRSGYLSSITLFTKLKTYQVDYINPQQAERFLSYVESQIYNPTLQNAINIGKEVLIS